ncbi:TBC1 domain family member 16 isoform X2 [Cephus cinctus]|uniref:TBC1 domain family member 16 isoform X2 n=1 Tax=Cephus cinctus TaxID=211228 RepID=A0AAJ7BZT0_CEPCN|nr:TBC1 domain family member 16 isoform X2 [Cephus cinctus]
MPLPSILRKASSYILGEGGQDTRGHLYQDGEVLFCKNNISEENCNSKFDYECPQEKVDVCLEVKEVVNCGDCERVCSGGFAKVLRGELRNSIVTEVKETDAIETPNNHTANKDSLENSKCPKTNGDIISKNMKDVTKQDECLESIYEERERGINLNCLHFESSVTKQPERTLYEEPAVLDLDTVQSAAFDYDRKSFDEKSIKSRSMSLTSTCSFTVTAPSDTEEFPTWMRSPELLALQHNLTFPESATASPVTLRRAHKCRRFSVDLNQMRSLRLFFADPACTCGQLVVASRESQYKILHFHHGGLDRLAATLHQWHQLLYPRLNAEAEEVLPYRHFMVCRPEVTRDELHPEEGQVPMITSLAWKDLLNERGQVEDDLALRKGIFFGGLEPALRKIVWPFLLHCYSYQSTYEEREQINLIRKQEYEEIERRRLNMIPEQAEHFWRNVVCIVEKDVIRTDRGNPYYAGEDNPNVEIMKNILLNYAVYNPRLGYTQGMSDLLAPLLAELNSETEAFWCFAGLMQRSVAVCTPTDMDMDRNLCYLRELIRIMVPDFYSHLEKHTDALELLFSHRWILLCLKREFPTEVALVMWEACWVNYLTDHFHLFLCLAIMCVYADDVIAQDLRTDEMLLHFSSLAMYMDGNVIIRKARGLLHHFRQLLQLPCTLAGLCRQCGPGMWDSSHNPVIVCVGHGDVQCPYIENY